MFLGGISMRDKKMWLGVLLSVFVFAAFSNGAVADSENNLLIKSSETSDAAHKAAFLVSKEQQLKKYENATSLSDHELLDLLKITGFRGDSLVTAWAVAKAESNGRPFAFNGNADTGDSSYGVFQINMIGTLGPDRRQKFDLDVNAELFNPVKNAEIAFRMTQGGKDWSAWKHAQTPSVKKWIKKFPVPQV